VTSSPDREYWEDRALKHGRLAGGYLDSWSEDYEQPLRWQAFTRICPIAPGQRVLDVGCGTGRMSVAIANLGADVVGADLSARMIEMAEPHPHVQYRVASADEIDYPDRSFDVVVTFTVLQHITDPGQLQRALRNLRRMLTDSGRFFVLEYSPFGKLPTAGLHYMRYRTHRQWIELITEQGFRLESSTGVRYLGRRAHALWRRLRGGKAQSGGGTRLIHLTQAVERGISRVPLLRERSDLHAYLFLKRGGTRSYNAGRGVS
jgi:SAM-dependent methyltransferase